MKISERMFVIVSPAGVAARHLPDDDREQR